MPPGAANGTFQLNPTPHPLPGHTAAPTPPPVPRRNAEPDVLVGTGLSRTRRRNAAADSARRSGDAATDGRPDGRADARPGIHCGDCR